MVQRYEKNGTLQFLQEYRLGDVVGSEKKFRYDSDFILLRQLLPQLRELLLQLRGRLPGSCPGRSVPS